MNQNPLFPIFLKLEHLRTLVVGGGPVGLEKLTALLTNAPAAPVTLVSLTILPDINALAERHPNVSLHERAFTYDDLNGHDIVILAANNRPLHAEIRDVARARHLLVNVADTPDLCDFYLGSVVTKGHVKIGISTNGQSPTLAKRLRETLDDALPDDMNELLANLRAIREQLTGDFSAKVKALNEVTASWLTTDRTT